MIVERTKKEVIFRVPTTRLSVDDLQALANWIEFQTILKKSKATQKEVDRLANQVKKGRWSRTKLKLAYD